MNIQDFKRIITSFADKPSDLQMDKGQLLTEIRGELIQVKVTTKDGTLYVTENDLEESAVSWIKNRIACLPQLAERILDYIPGEDSFVDPRGEMLDELEFDPEEKEREVEHSTQKLVEILGRKVPGTSSIVYLTSDAGEGKTTLINNLAKVQAKNFKEKKGDWLLVPIPLGGRPFLRFDDIVIASIVNNLRFRFFYYESFIELVRLGLLVPAFDGFEEMFMQSSTGEALSATGGLINKLESSGSILIAARKAYFDYKSFSSQAKLFDTINSSVSFARLAIQRWDKDQFVEYAKQKQVKNADDIYKLVSSKLNNKLHPILTRPVLIKQLLEVFSDIGNVEDLVSKLESATSYFPTFVNAIIEREANMKWIDTSGEPFKPILKIREHYELLSLLAEEMWLNNSESLKDSVLELISELFGEQNKFNVQTIRQIKERIKQHALIVRVDGSNPNYKFDHEEFREFFLGVSIANKIAEAKLLELRNILRKAPLPFQTAESIVSTLKSKNLSLDTVKTFLDEVIKGEVQTSFVKENIGNIIIRLINNSDVTSLRIDNYEFPTNSFSTVKLQNTTFYSCHFQNTSLQNSEISNCTFINSGFDRIEVNSLTSFNNVILRDCEISTVYDITKDKGFYDSDSIKLFLGNKGVLMESSEVIFEEVTAQGIVEDEDLELTEKALRRFIRSNSPINDNIFRIRLGNKADYFFKKIVPELLKRNILLELEYVGQGQKRRFKLGVSFSRIDAALTASKGNFEAFLNYFV